MSEHFTDTEYTSLVDKINKEWPVRCRLAELAGHKCNTKNPRTLVDTEFDLNIRNLYLEVLFRQPQNAEVALKLMQDFYK